MREVLSEYDLELVQRAHFLGVPALRKAIADYLYRSRGMNVSPECIVIGASIEYLYEKLIKLLPENSVYGAENPGYRKIPRIYEEFGLPWKSIEMDESGVSMASLRESSANIVHVSPEHHYPLGTVTTAGGARSCFPGQQRPRTAISSRMIMTASFATPPRAFLPCRAWI